MNREARDAACAQGGIDLQGQRVGLAQALAHLGEQALGGLEGQLG